MQIDFPTLAITLSIANLLQVSALVSHTIFKRAYHGPGWWILGMSSISLGFVAYAFKELRHFEPLSTLANNFLFAGGMLLILIGLRRFFGRPDHARLLLVIWILHSLLVLYSTLIRPDFLLRYVILSFMIGSIALACAYTIIRYKPHTENLSANFLALIFLITVVFFIFRALLALVSTISGEAPVSTSMQAMTYLMSLGYTTLWTFGFILLVNQRESHETRENLELAFNARLDAVLISRLEDAQLVDVNQGFCMLTGYQREEVIGQTVLGLELWANPDDRQRLVDLLAAHGKCINEEFVFRCKDGHLITGLLSARILPLHGVPHVISVVHDISERKQIEESLRESETRYRLISENATDVIWLMDPLTDRFTYVSPSVEKLRGYTPEQVLALPASAAMTETSRQMVQATLPQKITAFLQDPSNVQSRVTEIDQPHKDGHIIHTEVITNFVQSGQGKLQVIGVTRDITERKRAEQAMRETNAYLENLINYANAPIIVWDPQFRITRFNHAFEFLTGWTEAEVQGRSLDLLFPQDLVATSMEHIRKTLTGERWETVEIKILHRNGSVRTVLWNSATLFEADGQTPVATIAQGQDISERKRSEEELLLAKQQAEAANRAKSVFLANMSHELRTPLNAILGFSQLMAREPNLTPSQHTNLATINRSGEHLLQIINDVLDMAKIEAGRHTFQAGPIDLQRLLDDLHLMFRLRAEGKGLTLSMNCAPEVPRMIMSDEAKLRQILINLLGNAIKFTSSGSVVLRIACEGEQPAASSAQAIQDATEAPRQLRLVVQDSGNGITPEDIAQIFNPFIQASMTTKGKEGTGLGLTISHEFARLLGGDLEAYSSGKPGEGATFTLSLPLEVVKLGETQTMSRPQRKRAVHLEPGQPIYRLLVADDRLENSDLLVMLLTQLGFEVRSARNGQEALDLWHSWQPHMIWMDLRMPVMDGIDATQRIQEEVQTNPALVRPVIIAISASVLGEAQKRIFEAGCDAFVAKPFREHEIIEALEHHLGAQFVYIEEQEPEVSLALALKMPEDEIDASWYTELRQAAIEANLGHMLLLIDQLEAKQPRLAMQLRAWVETFAYDKLITWIELLEGQRS